VVKSSPLLVLLCLAGCASDEASIAACNPDAVPITRVAPALPPRLHNSFEGYAVVEFELSPEGQVQRAQIRTAEWTPVGRARGEPDGYEEALLSAVSQWRYGPVEQQCRATTRIEFQLEDPA
jgi:hypothetical protein